MEVEERKKKERIFGEFFETGLLSGMCCELVVKFQKIIYEYFLLVCPQYEVIYSKYDKTTAAAATLNRFLSIKSTQKNENKIDIPLSWKFARQCLDRH